MDTTGAAAGDLGAVTRDLLDEWGLAAARVRPVVLALAAGRWRTIGELVRDHGVSRRTVEGLAAALDPWLEQQGGRLRVREREREAVLAEWTPPGRAAEAPEEVGRTMAELMRGLPPGNRGLDHVPATPATAVRRAGFLAESFDLAGASVLCLGDHDLTSLALAQLCPAAEIAVVDVDERLLAYVGRVAEARGWRVRPLFADLRVELPPSVREACDLLFTDPPYTAAGTHLFLVRGLAALRRRDASRAVFCYGYGERHPALGLKVQAEYHRLHLLAEAILPRFNRYAGGEALGAASSLYVCRPTRRTWAALARARPLDPRIYSQGESADTSRLEPLPRPVVERVRRAAGEDRPLLVGERWLPDLAAGCHTLPLARYLEGSRAGGGRPPFTAPPHRGVVAVDLHPHLGGYLARLLLTAAARRLVAVVSPAAAADLLGGPLAALVGVRYRAARVPGDPSLVVADRLDAEPEDRVGRTLHRLLERPAATLGSAWREALTGAMAAEGRTVTKNGARAAIAATATGRLYGPCHLSELPLDRLGRLAEEVARSLESL